MSLKTAVQAAARRFGYTVVPDWSLDTFQLAGYLEKLFARLQVDCVLDVGANEGQYRDFLRGPCRFTGHIVSFEPNPQSLAVLNRRAAAEANWHVEPVALGAVAGQAEFNVMAASQFSSFLRPSNAEDQRYDDKNRIARSFPVTVRTVDEVLPELRRRLAIRSPYLKLDTQGFDLEVLKGAPQALPGIGALQTELYLRKIYQDAPGFDEVIRHLAVLGFAVGFVATNNPTSSFPIAVDLDCVMVNTHRVG